MNADKRPVYDFGVIAEGTWSKDGVPEGWVVDSSLLDDELPRWLLKEPVIRLSPGPNCSVYIRGCYSKRLTYDRKKAVLIAGGVSRLIKAIEAVMG